jgi:hypothetical protein
MYINNRLEVFIHIQKICCYYNVCTLKCSVLFWSILFSSGTFSFIIYHSLSVPILFSYISLYSRLFFSFPPHITFYSFLLYFILFWSGLFLSIPFCSITLYFILLHSFMSFSISFKNACYESLNIS